jgi:hypothetical protein
VFFSTLKAGHSGTQPISFQQLNRSRRVKDTEASAESQHAIQLRHNDATVYYHLAMSQESATRMLPSNHGEPLADIRQQADEL